jgi:hypothetical protein
MFCPVKLLSVLSTIVRVDTRNQSLAVFLLIDRWTALQRSRIYRVANSARDAHFVAYRRHASRTKRHGAAPAARH